MKFEELPTEKIYKYMPFSGFPNKLLFRFDGLKPCRYRECNVEDVVAPFKGLLKDFYEKFILSSQNLYNSKDWVGEDGKLTYSYDLSREGILFERRVRYI